MSTNQKTTIVAVALAGVAALAATYFIKRRKENKKSENKEEKEAKEDQVIENHKEEEVVIEEEKKPEVEIEKPVVEEVKQEVVEEKKVEEEKKEEIKVEEEKKEEIKEEKKEEKKVEEEKKEEKKPEEPKVEVVDKPTDAPVKKSSEYIEYYNAAKKLFNAQNYENALVNFDKSIEASPKNNPQMKTLVYSRASCLKKLNRLQESLEAYSRCIELDSKYSRAYKARCNVYKALNMPEKAMEDISFCYLLDTISKGDMIPAYEETEELITILAGKKTKEEIRHRYEDGTYIYHLPNTRFITFYFNTLMSEKYSEYNTSKLTIDELKEHIANYDKEKETEYTLGDYYLMLGGELKAKACYEDASKAFTEACKEENGCKDMNSAYLENATFINLTGNNRDAAKFYEKCYADPEMKKNVNLLVKYASCLLELGDDRYHSVFDEAVDLNPSLPDGYFHRGQLLFIENDIPRALADLNKVVQIDSNHAMAFVQIAFCYLQMNNAELAIQNMKRAIACNKNQAQVQNHYGELLMSLSRVSEAESAFKKAIEYDSRWPYTYVNLANLIIQTQQDCLSASNYYKKAIKIDHGCVSAMLQLAQLHTILQEFDDANSVLKNALEEAITENDIKQVCSMMIGMEYQVQALEKYQQLLKNEGVQH